VTGITDLARRLGATCIAEGVEDADQLSRLRQMGCHMAQGFHFAPALPPKELEQLVSGSGLPSTVRASWATDPQRAPG
jgi:EAL domain-containing protein (putative c-di-GMP-specific phosphodiesterase class I)